MSARELLEECREEMAGCCDIERPTRGMEALITRIDAHLSEPVAMPPDAIADSIIDSVIGDDDFHLSTEFFRKLCRQAKEANALRAWAARGELSGWQPIETAPKDGTTIIAWCVHENAKYSKAPIAEGWEAAVIAKWIDHNGGGWCWHGHAGTFTKWKPLDAPPALGESKP